MQYASILPAFTPGTPEPFTYDADGNLSSDGRWDYLYDAENRLSWMSARSAAVAAGHPRTAFHIYNDYLGRRVMKHPYIWSGSTWTTHGAQERYIYDGWNLIARMDNMVLTKNYFWGLDLSGSLQGAGGVGGLLMVQEGGETYLPMYDGNGNVMGMIKQSDGTIAAAYEYDAFGNTLRESGPYAASNPFRYSTKYTDTETGLIYYGLRYYSPTLGRFINKDPIEEQGGLNLYGFCGNNGINHYDYLGASWLSKTFKKLGRGIRKILGKVSSNIERGIQSAESRLNTNISINVSVSVTVASLPANPNGVAPRTGADPFGGMYGDGSGAATANTGVSSGVVLVANDTGSSSTAGNTTIVAADPGTTFTDTATGGSGFSPIFYGPNNPVSLSNVQVLQQDPATAGATNRQLVPASLTDVQRGNLINGLTDLRDNGGKLGQAFVGEIVAGRVPIVNMPGGIPQGNLGRVYLDLNDASFFSASARIIAADQRRMSVDALNAQVGFRGGLILGHEMGHAVLRIPDPFNVAIVENFYLRPAMGLPDRNYYNRGDVPTYNSTPENYRDRADFFTGN